MPWIAIPYGDPRVNELKKKFNVTGIPTLVILNSEGKVITDEAYGDVATIGPKAYENWLAT